MAIDLIEETEEEKRRKREQEDLDRIFADVMSYDSDYECQKPKKKHSQ